MHQRRPVRLSVNLNKVALLRNARDIGIPDLARAAHSCIDAGAHGITLHPRPDERHVRRQDVAELALLTSARGVELNVEGYPSAPFVALVERHRPAQCTLVPDAPDQRTSDHGWDTDIDDSLLHEVVHALRAEGIRVSIFVTPDVRRMTSIAALGADGVELFTGPYARAFDLADREAMLEACSAAALEAARCGLIVNAGHDLSLRNLPLFRARVPELAEVSIGHALISDALDVGLAGAVRAYIDVLRDAAHERADDRSTATGHLPVSHSTEKSNAD